MSARRCDYETQEATPIVSVIIVFHNEQRFLGEAIESIRAQDFDQYELLLVDDGSDDDSPAIARAAAASDPARVFVLSFPTGGSHGISAARNLGMSHARGRYVAFLDGDDVWEPGKLREQVEILEADQSLGMVYGRTLIWHSWSAANGDEDFFYDLGLLPDRPIAPFDPLRVMIENKVQTPTTCNAMFRLELALAEGGAENEFRGMFEDQVLFAKIMANSAVYVSERSWARYRQHPDSACARSSPLAEQQARVAFLKWLKGYLAGMENIPISLEAEVHKQLWRARRAFVYQCIRWLLPRR